ncbi:MAG: 1-acyl-sn-glycerol-3-phosphate acyltransferase [Bdellovibrionota bacterium]
MKSWTTSGALILAIATLASSFPFDVKANVACEALFGSEDAALWMQPYERIGYSHPLFPVVEGIVRMRYDMRVQGLDAVAVHGRRGILFIMNHPSFSDPAIVTVALKDFQVAPVMGAHVVAMPVIGKAIGYGTNKVDAIYVPRRKPGESKEEHVAHITAIIAEAVARLDRGENVVLWPAGEIMKDSQSHLGQKRMLHDIVKELPDVRVVLGRTTGLWGSSLGFGATGKLDLGRGGLKAAEATVSKLVTGPLTPRRKVSIEFIEPMDLPRDSGRTELNQYVETWFNAVEQPKVLVPYNPIENAVKGTRVIEPESPAK